MAASRGSSQTQANTRERIDLVLLSDYEIAYEVGEGTYGVVYKACEKANRQQQVAIKKIKATKEGEGISLTACREVMLLNELKHENIIRLRRIHLNAQERSLYLVFDYAEYDLFEIIKYHHDRTSYPLPESALKSLLWQLLNGISYLHANWVLHRDLKPSNILVMGEGPDAGMVKIADFGLARIFQSPLRPLSDNGVVVTIWYRAPELLMGAKHYTRAVDIWAIGCIFAELLTTNPLFPGNEKSNNQLQDDQLDRIFRILGKPSPERWPGVVDMPEWNKIQAWPHWKDYPNSSNLVAHLSSQLGMQQQGLTVHSSVIDLLGRMLQYDPAKRITASEALDHAYFRESPLPMMNAFAGYRVPYPARRSIQKKPQSKGKDADR